MAEYPYSDDLMIFDSRRGRYVLTEAALESGGIFLRQRLERSRGAVDATAVINGVCRTASTHIYNYIHSFNHDNSRQDELIAKAPSLRTIIFDAMLEQTKYIIFKGDRTMSSDPDEQKNYIHPSAALILTETVRELGGRSILFSGRW